jgi:hypothetical protein
MFIAMNRFKVRKDEEAAFEDRWRERDTHLHTVAGFVEFHLLRGRSATTTCFTRRIRYRSRAPISRRGRGQKRFAPPIAMREPVGRSRFLTLNSKGSRSFRSYAPTRQPRRLNNSSDCGRYRVGCPAAKWPPSIWVSMPACSLRSRTRCTIARGPTALLDRIAIGICQGPAAARPSGESPLRATRRTRLS